MMWQLTVVFCALVRGATSVAIPFPPGFRFGAATSAYQVEGAWNVSDKGLSIWDTFTLDSQRHIPNGETGQVACDSYHLWEVDVEIAANLSLDFYRFSISWPRLLPNGFPSHISEDGKNYYNKLIDGLLARGIQPVVTLYHWDLPQRLQNLGGWTNPYIADWFANYADIAFSLYADRVKTWITLNEPLLFCDAAYDPGFFNAAPGFADVDVGTHLCNKHALLAHAKAYRVYEKNYRERFHGQISIANQIMWYEGLTEAEDDLAEMSMAYTNDRYTDAIYSKEGGWPSSLEKYIAEKSKKEGFLTSRLPAFSKEEIDLVKGTFDFFAFNHYSSRAVRKALPGESAFGCPIAGISELGVKLEGRPEWTPASYGWLLQNPEGMRNSLARLKRKYGDIPILITENGYSSDVGSLDDDDRVEYYRNYLEQLLLLIYEDHVNVIGYTAWTMIDNFEWGDGYRSKFGLYQVDFSSPNRTRTPRKSAYFYADVIKQHSLNVTTDYVKTELYSYNCGGFLMVSNFKSLLALYLVIRFYNLPNNQELNGNIYIFSLHVQFSQIC